MSDLLRRVKFVAVKLGLGAVEDWVEHELKGYEVKPPEYRKVHGRPMAFNPYHGWMAMGGHTEQLSWMRNPEPVSVLEDLIRSCSRGGSLQVSYPDKIKEMLDEQNGVRWNYCLEISPSELGRILDRVRTLILEWALDLEKAGIMGTEDSFGQAEKQKAQAASPTINIGSIGQFVGNMGQGNSSGDIDASDGIKIDQLTSIVSQLRNHSVELVEAGADGKRLEERLGALETAIAKNDRSALRGILTDVRNSLSGAAGSLIASGAMNVLNVMLGTGVPST
ncbi:AbiTii domain-containing protein [Bradyrhizobium sp. LB13.1]